MNIIDIVAQTEKGKEKIKEVYDNMSLGNDIQNAKEMLNDIKDIEDKHSFLWEIMHDLKRDKNRVITANIILSICLIIAIIIIFIK